MVQRDCASASPVLGRVLLKNLEGRVNLFDPLLDARGTQLRDMKPTPRSRDRQSERRGLPFGPD
jgi:hypothetical protein